MLIEKKISSKRSQFKIQQMAFMLLAVVLFFILVALIWITIQQRNLHKQATQLEEEKAVFLSEFLSGSSEFSCSREMGSYCIDTDKLVVLENMSVYRDFWPVAFIQVRKLDRQVEEVECSKLNYPNCNLFEVYENKNVKSKSSIGNFVALCRYENINGFPKKICELGKFIIGYEIK